MTWVYLLVTLWVIILFFLDTMNIPALITGTELTIVKTTRGKPTSGNCQHLHSDATRRPLGSLTLSRDGTNITSLFP